MELSPAGDRLLTIHEDAARLWTEDGKPIARLEAADSVARKPATTPWPAGTFSPRGDRVATSYTPNAIGLWDRQGRHVRWLDIDRGVPVGHPRYLEQQDLMLMFGSASKILVFDFDGRLVEQLPGRRWAGSGGA